jgi:hypothetical protein
MACCMVTIILMPFCTYLSPKVKRKLDIRKGQADAGGPGGGVGEEDAGWGETADGIGSDCSVMARV